jgi:hypothetical protein
MATPFSETQDPSAWLDDTATSIAIESLRDEKTTDEGGGQDKEIHSIVPRIRSEGLPIGRRRERAVK